MSSRETLFAVMLMSLPVGTAASQAAAPSNVVALDFVKAKPGELGRLVRFYELNWAAARTTVRSQSVGVTGFRMLVRADTASTWDIMLETVYADSSAYARREEIFAPVLKAKGKVLVDGKDRSALGEIVASRVMVVPPNASR